MGRLLQNLLGLPFSSRQRRLSRTRDPLGETEFVRLTVEQGGDGAAGASLWSRLLDWSCAEHFTPYPTDSLGSVYGIAEEERDEDLVLGIFRELKVPTPGKALLTEFGPVDTPLQIAQLVARCRKQGTA